MIPPRVGDIIQTPQGSMRLLTPWKPGCLEGVWWAIGKPPIMVGVFRDKGIWKLVLPETLRGIKVFQNVPKGRCPLPWARDSSVGCGRVAVATLEEVPVCRGHVSSLIETGIARKDEFKVLSNKNVSEV